MSLRIITDATQEMLTLDEVRLHLRLDSYNSPADHPDDPLLRLLIPAAREWAENFTGRTIARKTLEFTMDQFPGGWYGASVPLELPGAPIQQIVSVKYYDAANVLQTYTDYQFDNTAARPRLSPLHNTLWPVTYGVRYAQQYGFGQYNAATVRYIAGYSLDDMDSPVQFEVLPKSIKQAMLLVIGHWYESRENASIQRLENIPLGAETLLRQYRLETSIA